MRCKCIGDGANPDGLPQGGVIATSKLNEVTAYRYVLVFEGKPIPEKRYYADQVR